MKKAAQTKLRIFKFKVNANLLDAKFSLIFLPDFSNAGHYH